MTLFYSHSWSIFWLGIIPPYYQWGLSLVIKKIPKIAVAQTSWSLFFSHVKDFWGISSSQFSTLTHVRCGPCPHGPRWWPHIGFTGSRMDGGRCKEGKGQPELSHMDTLSFKGGWKCNFDSGWLCAQLKIQDYITKEELRACCSNCPPSCWPTSGGTDAGNN